MKDLICRRRIDLGGMWNFRVPDGEYTKRRVPGSYFCCGFSEYNRSFSWTKTPGKRVFLCTEGINYEGTVLVNGQVVGKTMPYCHDAFDVTDLLKDENEVTVQVKDIYAPFGMVAGWCCYGGIIRAIYLEERSETYFADVWFRQNLTEDLTRADATVSVELAGKVASHASVTATLSRHGETVAIAEGRNQLAFSVERPALWSPDAPNLYDLCVTLEIDGEIVDTQAMEVGFRSFKMDEKRFYLNGEPIFLAGVCRHDLGSAEKGHTLTDEDIERDMRMIKDLGVNFVRLVHYPHDERVIRMADRMGLLVSEEPGLWWSDLTNPNLTGGALEILKRTILRDRSHPSVAFWMSFNECEFTQEFLNDSVKVARAYDPDRYASGANCMNIEMTKSMFDIADIDFYTFHPYGTDPTSVANGIGVRVPIKKHFDSFVGKPLIFTEWGGWFVVDNPELFRRFCQSMKQAKNEGKLAGMFYWAFADMYEYNRADASVDGVQYEGLVTLERRPKENYYVFQKFLREINSEPVPLAPAMVVEPDGLTDTTQSVAIPLPDATASEEQQAAWEYATEESRMTQTSIVLPHRKRRYITYGPKLPQSCPSLGNLQFDARQQPLVVSEKAPRLEIPLTGKGRQLVLLGNALYTMGYPVNGEYGEVCAKLTLRYADGTETVTPLRNGYELLTVNTTFAGSKIDPISPILKKAITFSYNKNFENYRIYTLTVDLKPDTELVSMTVTSEMAERNILLYGVSLIP